MTKKYKDLETGAFRKVPNPCSLITNLEGEEPLSVTMSLDLGEVINRLDKEYICVGSGDVLGGVESFKGEEIRAYIVKKEDLITLRNIFKKWTSKKSALNNKKEVAIKTILGNKDKGESIIQNEEEDILFTVLLEDKVINIRFNKKDLKFIKGVDISQKRGLYGTEIYVHGLALLTKFRNWEIQGRALLTVED